MPFSEELISPLLGNGLHVITNMLKYNYVHYSVYCKGKMHKTAWNQNPGSANGLCMYVATY